MVLVKKFSFEEVPEFKRLKKLELDRTSNFPNTRDDIAGVVPKTEIHTAKMEQVHDELVKSFLNLLTFLDDRSKRRFPKLFSDETLSKMRTVYADLKKIQDPKADVQKLEKIFLFLKKTFESFIPSTDSIKDNLDNLKKCTTLLVEMASAMDSYVNTIKQDKGIEKLAPLVRQTSDSINIFKIKIDIHKINPLTHYLAKK